MARGFRKEKKLNKEVLKNIALSATCVVIGVICDLIQIRISGKLLNMTQNRMGSIKNIPKNIYYMFSSLGYILTDTYNLFPKYIFILYIKKGLLHLEQSLFRNIRSQTL